MTRLSFRNLRRAVAPTFALLIAAAALSGCFNPFNPMVARNRVAASEPPPWKLRTTGSGRPERTCGGTVTT